MEAGQQAKIDQTVNYDQDQDQEVRWNFYEMLPDVAQFLWNVDEMLPNVDEMLPKMGTIATWIEWGQYNEMRLAEKALIL